MTQLLSQEQMEKRVEISAAFAKMVTEKSRSFLGNIINMAKSAATFLSPETKLSPRNGIKRQTMLHQGEGPSKPNAAGSPFLTAKELC